MKAIVYKKYGLPNVLALQEVSRPMPKDDEILIKVHCASLNASDWEMLRGKPLYARFWGLFRPKIGILGSDIAGTVEAVGKDVSRFQPGDAVLADLFERWGGLADYVCAPEDACVGKPDTMTFDDAAALPQAGVIALQGIRDRAQPGHKVLINGAGGGAGTFAVQIAKLSGAEITAVDSGPKLATLAKLGADHVVDYAAEDFTRTGRHYDVILDMVATRSAFACRRALSDTGVYLAVGGSIPALLKILIVGNALSRSGSRRIGILAVKQNTDDLAYVRDLVDAGTIRPVIDNRFALPDTPKAFTRLGAGRAIGKIVIAIA